MARNKTTDMTAQIAAWKKEHKDVFAITVGDKTCYVHKPTRQILSAAFTQQNDPIKMGEFLLNNCWLGGDEEIREDDAMFLAAVGKLNTLVEVKEAEIKKL